MCRWFAYLSPTEDCLLEDVLVTPKNSLARQVHDHYLPKLLAHPDDINEQHAIDARNRLFNIDGLGMAWYTPAQNDFLLGNDRTYGGQRPALFKTVSPPLNDLNFRSICKNTATTTVFAHIRAASATATSTVNNHPFVFGRHAIMHNGVISDFLSIRREVCNLLDPDTFGNIQGTTDSEHLAALYMTYLCGTSGSKKDWEKEYSATEMDKALYKTFDTIIKLQRKVLGDKAQPNSLNVAVTDGTKLVCYRFRNSRKEQPPSLYYSTTAGVTLNRKYPDTADGPEGSKGDKDLAFETASGTTQKGGRKLDPDQHGKHIIVSSEPSTYKDSEWDLVGKNCKVVVEGDINKDGVLEMKDGEVRIEPIDAKDEWMCEVLEGAEGGGYGTTG